MNSWIIIPARGGSKTIPLKNLAPLAERKLISYVLRAAKAWGKAERVIVSTDSPEIARVATDFGAIVAGRPKHLCGDDVPVAAVIEDLLNQDKKWPDIIILLQPTSPFVLPRHIDDAVNQFRFYDDDIDSCETITEVPHNHHEYNQREIKRDHSYWLHPKERRECYNKQTKPDRYVFGNLAAFRPRKFMKHGDLFIYPRRCIVIPRAYAHDVDDELDLAMAEAMIEKGIVKLEHLIK